MSDALSLRARFIENFNALAKGGPRPLETNDIVVALAEYGVNWDEQKVRRILNHRTKSLSLDEYMALARIVGRTVEEMTDADIDKDALVRIQQTSLDDLVAGMRRAYLAAFDILNARTRFLSTSRRLRDNHGYTAAPTNLDAWAKAWQQIDGHFFRDFVQAFVDAEAAVELSKAERPARAWEIEKWEAERSKRAEKTLHRLLMDE